MEFFKKAKSVRLLSHHQKFLIADADQETVFQDRRGTTRGAKWEVEFVEDYENVIRLRSCHGKYLTASEDPYKMGLTGRKVRLTMPSKKNSSIEWEPIREGKQVRLKSRYGNFLRANGGLPPWRNSITHDIPHRHSDWVLWEVDLVELRPEPPKEIPEYDSDLEADLSVFTLRTPGFSTDMSDESGVFSPKPSQGRTVYYKVVDEYGNIDEEQEEQTFIFKGQGIEELTVKLGEETEHDNIILCLRNKFNGQLYPLRLALPPNNATMHIVVVPSTSKAAGDFLPKS